MIKWGILGAGNIAHRFSASLSHEEGTELVAAACRTRERAEAFLTEVPHAEGARAYGGFDALLADPDVDAIYLSLPHAFHHEWAIKALRAGKAVLSEKPAMITADEMAEVASVAREEGLLFMEAMKPRFVPLYQQVVDAVAEIGDLVRVETSLCNDMLGYVGDRPTYHMHGGRGAGVLLDTGTYCASWIEDFCPGVPVLTGIAGTIKDGVDIYVDAKLDHAGVASELECSFERGKPRTATLVGTEGSICVEELHRPQRAVLTLADGSKRVLEAPYYVDDFYGEVHHFCDLLRAGKTESPLMTLEDSIGCARILDTIRAGFTPTPQTLSTLEEQERILRYPERFGAAEALALGNRIAQLDAEYDREVTIQIIRESDGMQLFALSMDSKAPRNYDYIAGKRGASLECGHSSVYLQQQMILEGKAEQLFARMPDVLPSGGAFPIRLVGSDEVVATLCVSGLHEGLDHELMVRALEAELGVKAPALTTVVS